MVATLSSVWKNWSIEIRPVFFGGDGGCGGSWGGGLHGLLFLLALGPGFAEVGLLVDPREERRRRGQLGFRGHAAPAQRVEARRRRRGADAASTCGATSRHEGQQAGGDDPHRLRADPEDARELRATVPRS